MSKSLDRLTLLATFARIAERGSISAAARDLGLSQASASRHLAELERRLGVTLMQRTTHDLSLTDAGEDCMAEARGLLAAWDALAERHAMAEGAIRGRLKIVAPMALGQLFLAEAAARFRQAHPGVALTWILDDAPIRFAEIGCDLWIRVGRVPDETLVVRPLGRVERLIVAAPALIGARPIARPADLADLPCAAVQPFEGGRIALSDRRGGTEMIAARVGIDTNSILAAHRAVLLGAGYAVMPRWLVDADLARGALVDLLPGWRANVLTINAAFLPARRQTRRLQVFVADMASAVAAIPGVTVEAPAAVDAAQ